MSNPNDEHPLATLSFWKATFERVITTLIVCYIAIFLIRTLPIENFYHNWYTALAPSGAAAFLNLVKCILAGLGGNPGPSVANETLTDYPRIGRID